MFYHFRVATFVNLMTSYSFEVASVPGRGKVRIHKQTVENLVFLQGKFKTCFNSAAGRIAGLQPRDNPAMMLDKTIKNFLQNLHEKGI